MFNVFISSGNCQSHSHSRHVDLIFQGTNLCFTEYYLLPNSRIVNSMLYSIRLTVYSYSIIEGYEAFTGRTSLFHSRLFGFWEKIL